MKNLYLIRVKQEYIKYLKSFDAIYCIKNQTEIIKRANKVYDLVTKHNKSSLIKRSCNFKLLEIKSKEYMKDRH